MTRTASGRFRGPKRTTITPLTLLTLGALATTSMGQGGTSDATGKAESTRYDNEFNPAIRLAVDFITDFMAFDGPTSDGLDAEVRRVDLMLGDWIDTDTLVWARVAYQDEEFDLNEAAIEYAGLPRDHRLRAGRFFLDFGSQMQLPVQDLRTIERPGVLSAYLGEQLVGTGVQWRHFTELDHESRLTYSVGGYADLGDGERGYGDPDPTDVIVGDSDRKGLEELGVVARVAARTEHENKSIEAGTSLRLLNDFTFAQGSTGLQEGGQSNFVVGFDGTYRQVEPEEGLDWTAGGECLLMNGDLSAEFDDNGTPGNPADDRLRVENDTVFGGYAFADVGWNDRDSAGAQCSIYQMRERGTNVASELDLYFTRQISKYLRLRTGVTFVAVDGGEDSVRLAIQLTGSVGSRELDR